MHSWFDPAYQDRVGVGGYSRVWHATCCSPRVRGRLPATPGPGGPGRGGPGGGTRRSQPRLAGWVAFVATGAHFVLVYALPTTGVPWPAGIVIAPAPIAAGALAIRRLRPPDELPVVTGILGFFVLLDALIGLGGRYDSPPARCSRRPACGGSTGAAPDRSPHPAASLAYSAVSAGCW